MTITSLDELEKLLKILKESDVQVFKLGDMQLVMAGVIVESDEDDEEMDVKSPVGFEITDLRDLGIKTEFDE